MLTRLKSAGINLFYTLYKYRKYFYRVYKYGLLKSVFLLALYTCNLSSCTGSAPFSPPPNINKQFPIAAAEWQVLSEGGFPDGKATHQQFVSVSKIWTSFKFLSFVAPPNMTISFGSCSGINAECSYLSGNALQSHLHQAYFSEI